MQQVSPVPVRHYHGNHQLSAGALFESKHSSKDYVLYYSGETVSILLRMPSVGETLRRERERRGLVLERISLETKISLKLLEAIEADQFERLPGGVLTRSFVRQYARVLGLEEDEIGNQLRQQLHEPALDVAPRPGRAAPPLSIVGERLGFQNSSTRGRAIPALALLVVMMLACAGIYALWQNRSTIPTAARTRPLAPAAAPAPAPAPLQQDLLGTAPNTAAPGTITVVLAAGEDTWISVMADGKQVFAGTLRTSQSRTVDATGKIRITTGNAGGLEVSFNGKPVGPLGPRGQVRIVDLSPAGVHIVSRKPPSSGDSL